MPHMLLIVEPIGQREGRVVEGGKVLYQQMLDFTEGLKCAGVLMATSSLATAATQLLRPQRTAVRVLDGPFAEAKGLLDGAGLKASAHGWRVGMAADGQRHVLNGPFAETRELIANYTLIQVRSRDEAIEWSRPLSQPNTARQRL